MKKFTPPLSSPTELRKKFDHYLTLPPPQKYKMGRLISAETVAMLNKTDHSLDDLNLYEEILREAVKLINFPSACKAGLSKIAFLRLQVMGIPEPKISLKKNIELPTDIANFVIRDPTLPEYSLEETKVQTLTRMNNGEFFCFSTGADGWFNVQLRLVEGPEPILTLKEYKRVQESSQEAIIQIPSGKIIISGYGNEAISEDATLAGSLEVPPGFYKMRVFVFTFPTDDFSYYVVFARTDKFTPNALLEIDSIP